ncbi:MlaD family protein [Mycobacterium bourgelatii]|uniref:Putative Mce family protein n=1 Tax=Mycobacterium bourgelatii TaxID=1273442 RepID=A0A7I9YJL9_MYCBU|nr:MlaD family protein [Mycobacterium bourgelatii]MCV6975437.1 MCE family protein [Mycobacterium bourgelatii]GFG88693.1 putative Mce family protein [Mycobacterium bourgelatii]
MTTHRCQLAWLVAFLTFCFALTWIIYVTLRRDVVGPTASYTATFTDVTGLRAGSDVRMAGVRVGRVDDIDLSGDLARVRFRIERHQPVYGNTKVAVVYQNIIGQRYLSLSLADFGQPDLLAPDATIPLDHTEPSFDVTELLNGFEPLFTLLDPDNRGNLSNALIKALQGDSNSLALLIAETSHLAQSMSGPDDLLGQLINSLNAVTHNLASQGKSLETTLTQVRAVVAGLNVRRDELITSVGSISTVVDRISAIMTATRPDLDDTLNRQPGLLRTMVADQDQFATLGANLPAVLKGVARITGDSTAMSAQACDFNFTLLNFLKPIVPSIVNAATPGGQRKYSAQCR